MNKLFAFVSLILLYSGAEAQRSDTPFFTGLYLTLGIGKGKSGNCGQLNASVLFKDKWVASVGHTTYSYPAPNLPSDYPNCQSLLGPYATDHSVDITTYHIGYELWSYFKRIRFGIEAGLSKVTYRTTTFTPQVVTYGWFGPTCPYHITYNDAKVVGFSCKPKLEFPVTRIIGVEFSPYFNVNKLRSVYLIQGSLMLGLLRSRIKKTSNTR